MATRFRTLACPVDASTGDQRRFAEGALTAAPCPMPLRYTPQDVGGHDGAVTIGAIQDVQFSPGEIWLEGTLFDDVDREAMPRLAENVAEAMKFISEGVLGLSVDLDDFEAELVKAGTDDPLTVDDLDVIEDPDVELEMLVTRGRIRAGTMVDIPAYVETNHTFELFPGEDVEPDAEATPTAALIASVGVAERVIPLAAFTPPVPVTGPMQIRYDFSVTPPMAYGHVLTWGTCHEGFADTCVLAPRDPSGYRDFHVHPVETDAGVMYTGRITAGGVHAPLDLGTHAVRKVHDAMEVVADVRAVEDEFGLLICGPIRDGLSDETLRILSRRKVSGDWRENAEGLALVEVLALKPGPRAISEPGFPVFGFRNGRQISLTAAMGPRDDAENRAPGYAEIFRTAYQVIREEDAKEAEAQRLHGELAEVIAADAAMMREDLIKAMGA